VVEFEDEDCEQAILYRGIDNKFAKQDLDVPVYYVKNKEVETQLTDQLDTHKRSGGNSQEESPKFLVLLGNRRLS
jgi:hypothetical protein